MIRSSKKIRYICHLLFDVSYVSRDYFLLSGCLGLALEFLNKYWIDIIKKCQIISSRLFNLNTKKSYNLSTSIEAYRSNFHITSSSICLHLPLHYLLLAKICQISDDLCFLSFQHNNKMIQWFIMLGLVRFECF